MNFEQQDRFIAAFDTAKGLVLVYLCGTYFENYDALIVPLLGMSGRNITFIILNEKLWYP